MSIHEVEYLINKGPIKLFKKLGQEVPATDQRGKPTTRVLMEDGNMRGGIEAYDITIVGPREVELTHSFDGVLVEPPVILRDKEIDSHPLVGRAYTCVISKSNSVYSEASQVDASL